MINFEELLSGVEGVSFLHDNPASITISGIQYDYRLVEPGDLFVSIPRGLEEPHLSEDGFRRIDEAISRGAHALLLQADLFPKRDYGIPTVLVPNANLATAAVAANFYNYPVEKMKLTGVIGTNGKTSICSILAGILDHCGLPSATLGTLGLTLKGRVHFKHSYTTPQATTLHHLAVEALDAGTAHMVAEITSHGIYFERASLLNFPLLIFTNFSQDHLDLHETMQAYLDVKLLPFQRLPQQQSPGTALINTDDPEAETFIAAAKGAHTLTYGLNNPCDYRATEICQTLSGLSFRILFPGGDIRVQTQLHGTFNVYNSLASFAAAHFHGLHPTQIVGALAELPTVSGRFEVIEHNGVMAVIDFAHTPDALEKVLSSLREMITGRLIAVFGCGGDRDPFKRPKMGALAEELADIVVLTSDNPRTENPHNILLGIRAGMSENAAVTLIEDRALAIEHALSIARQGDAVLIAGKGHEDTQTVGGEKIPLQDQQEVRRFIHKSSPFTTTAIPTY